MKGLQRLQQLWNWIPAFRAVAETEHLPTAAKTLHVTPPALSRSIRLLEEHVGQPLFDRINKRLKLNQAGSRLLLDVRDAMRRIDDGLNAVDNLHYRGLVTVAASYSLTASLLVDASAKLFQRYPEIVLQIVSRPAEKVGDALREGSIDLALMEGAPTGEGLATEHMIDLSYSVYCGRKHPLFKAHPPRQSTLLSHAFVGPSPGIEDGWPKHIKRILGIRVNALPIAFNLCLDGRYLALLPDRIAARALKAKQLRRLPYKDIRSSPVLLVMRAPLGTEDKISAATDALREAAGGS